MRTPPLPADFTYTRVCKPFCEEYLTLPEVEEVLEYARREFEEAVEEGEREKKGSPAE